MEKKTIFLNYLIKFSNISLRKFVVFVGVNFLKGFLDWIFQGHYWNTEYTFSEI